MTKVSKKGNNGHRVAKLVSLFHVTPQYVRLVLRGKRNNKAITDAYAFLLSEEKKAVKAIKLQTTKK